MSLNWASKLCYWIKSITDDCCLGFIPFGLISTLFPNLSQLYTCSRNYSQEAAQLSKRTRPKMMAKDQDSTRTTCSGGVPQSSCQSVSGSILPEVLEAHCVYPPEWCNEMMLILLFTASPGERAKRLALPPRFTWLCWCRIRTGLG